MERELTWPYFEADSQVISSAGQLRVASLLKSLAHKRINRLYGTRTCRAPHEVLCRYPRH